MREGETGLLVPPAAPAALAGALESVRHGLRFSEQVIAATHARSGWGGLVRILEDIASAGTAPRC